jgi:hypothetical protein
MIEHQLLGARVCQEECAVFGITRINCRVERLLNQSLQLDALRQGLRNSSRRAEPIRVAL